MNNTLSLSLIGFGEAGSSFADAAGWKQAARVFDVRPVDYETAGVTGCKDAASAVRASPIVLSLVTADQTLPAAQAAAAHIQAGAYYFDMNSVAPDTKRAAAAVIEAAGGHYLDVAVMAPVNPQRLSVPLLVSGPGTEAACTVLRQLGFSNVRSVGETVGRAASIKMIRSVMIKGQEALTAEMMLAARKAGVTDDVLASLGEEWPAKAAYNLERMAKHGARRAAEMEEVELTLQALGIAPLMTRATVIWQREMAA
jgi:3-hydroxyisobutyrate dehydrogenase-like beta-hydroxyacid dehydrogenase